MTKIVILDRDGVINHDSCDYIKSAEEWQPIDGSLEAIALLHNHGFKIAVATNQSGLARNLFSPEVLAAMHSKMELAINCAGGELAGIFYCPHHPDDNCDCRKPRTGLLKQISLSLGSDLQGVPFVGDSASDLAAASNFGCHPVLVKTGKGNQTLTTLEPPLPDIFDNLYAAAQAIVRQALL